MARIDGAWLEQATVLELDGKSKYLLARDGVVDPEASVGEEKAVTTEWATWVSNGSGSV